MSGLLLIVLFVGYISLVIRFFIKVKPLWGKAGVLVAAILIPTADDFYYRQKLDVYCESEAGYKIYEHASKKSGLVHQRDWKGSPDYLDLVSVSFGEFYDRASKKVYRYERQENGDFKTIISSDFTAPYEFIRKTERYGPFLESELLIIHIETGEILGQVKDLNYFGGWFRRGLLGSLAASGPTRAADCGISDAQAGFELVNRVFTQN